ncbi:unnamed protein product [Tilletia controversa]|uniref:T6SS Phospholipase effector Tle1-like catalytic domain-containing protein n=3 Tax=Tilletia TaxID=13289 RepID=A0A8X7MS46_9BASI|nr:hypothetical protein CF336_g4853 [Tilletia laevis]KAE8195397.1 hypothetical protein CF328_g4450 [Tilletia controversa]KAE8259190.1 hypothetical protein A4X03_0g4167 [Tilletia caries]KAE8199853.1 hypothetical protein CF335_g4074 [Tilletia laevis]KAE8246034.1 hypothetical protein A4X06_0g5239 [Tilletia controversa]
MHQKKKLVLLLDGTWSSRTGALIQWIKPRASDDKLTNVALLGQAIKTVDAKGTPQISFYQDGVGTSDGLLANIIAGATGVGLADNLIEAYSFLVDNYNDGDEIFLVGFSRGAYTARALSGFIVWAGIMEKAQLAHIQAIYKAYRQRSPSNPEQTDMAAQVFWRYTGKWPSEQSSRVENLVMQQHAAAAKTTPAQGAAWKSKFSSLFGGKGRGQDSSHVSGSSRASENLGTTVEVEIEGDVERTERGPRVEPPKIRFIGVMDTIGALGVPGSYGSRWWRQFYEFFDTGLSTNVQTAWQALALEEERSDFRPTLWYHFEPRSGQELTECYYQGSHADVGGSLTPHGLSDIVLASLCAQLTDHADGPLLALDLEHVKKTQDRSAAWAKQAPQKSRWFFEFRKTRQVCDMLKADGTGENGYVGQSYSKEPQWADEIPYGPNREMLHHSVVTGGRIDPAKAPQFQLLRERDPERLRKMWASAADESSLLPTERYLRWHNADVKQPIPKVVVTSETHEAGAQEEKVATASKP